MKKFSKFIALGVLLGLSLGLCSAAWAAKDTLTVGLTADARSLDPHATNDAASCNAMIQLYEPLLEVAQDKSLTPMLAESWEQVDPLTYKFQLRKGVKFHNGEEMKADDAIFSLHRMTNSVGVKLYGDLLDPDGFEKIDDYTFTLKTRTPMVMYLPQLCHSSAYIMNKKYVEEAGEDYGDHPIGTGPFKFVSAVKNERTVMERFDDYWGEKAKAKTLIFRIIPEANSRVVELETGNVDLINFVPFNEVKRLRTENKVDVSVHPGMGTLYFGLNCQMKPFDDPRVRKAISMGIDKQAIVDAVFEGLAAVPVIPLLPKHLYYPDNLPAFVHDPEGAKKLLAEAEFPKDYKMEIYTNDLKERIDTATILQEQITELGINCEVQILEWGAFLERLGSGNLSTFISLWGSLDINPDPDSYVAGAFHSKNAGPSNRTWLKDDKVDELLDLGRVTPDGPEREKIYLDLCDRINEIGGWLYIARPDVLYGVGKNVKGADLYLSGGHASRMYQIYAE